MSLSQKHKRDEKKLKRRLRMGQLRRQRIHWWLTVVLQAALLLAVVLAFVEGRWLAGATTLGIVLIGMLPVTLGKRFNVQIPPAFNTLAVLFVYASLFLGEVHGYYTRFWWWDVLLHTGSGFLLGIFGFLLVYVLNEKENIAFHMKPGFVALFAFMFAVGMGALWEIFEFAMDQIFGMNMQKSGLVDTMWDLIVDTIGATVISLLGWAFLSKPEQKSFLERWIDEFVHSNPRFFRKDSRGREAKAQR